MQEDPERALNYVATAYVRCSKYLGQRDKAPMAEVLFALSEASPKAITERNGPRAWARRQCSKGGYRILSSGPEVPKPDVSGHVIPWSAAESGRDLVHWIAWWIGIRGLEGKLRREHCANLAFWIAGIVAQLAPLAGWGKPASSDVDAIDARITDELCKVCKRTDYNARHLAIAVLVGWGMSRPKAKDALRNVLALGDTR
jgi:hypothetical protein